MQHGITHSICLMAMTASFATALIGQPAQSAGASNGATDFTGIWVRKANPAPSGVKFGSGDQFGFSSALPPLTAWGQARLKSWGTVPWQEHSGSTELYPYCLPGGFPRDYTEPYPFQVVQNPDTLVMIFEWMHSVRVIHMDGRKHLESAPPTSTGDSIAHWEGDTLVVDTIGIDTLGFIDGYGNPRSEAMHIVERIRRVDHDTLQIDLTFDDPIAYTKSFTGKKMYKLMPANTALGQLMPCEDHFKEIYSEDLKSGTMQGRP